MCSGSLLASHYFPLDFITQGKVLVCFVAFPPPKCADGCVGKHQEGVTPLHLYSSNWPTSCTPLVTAGAPVTKGKGDRTQNPVSSWVPLWPLPHLWEELLETICLLGSEISPEDFSALPLLFPASTSLLSEFHLP